MKLNLDAPLFNQDDSPAMEGDKPVTARVALIRAVLSEVDGDQLPIKGEEKIKRYGLYKLVKKATEETEFDVEDVAALKKAVLVFPPLVAGQVRDLLNG
jgi:hypothetical protein